MGLTVVIGAGAAGIAAARTLHDAGAEVLLVEAGDRIGGRAHSVSLASLLRPAGIVPASTPLSPRPDGWNPTRTRGDEAVDFGCGWLHSARRNPWTAIAERSGFAVDRSSPNWDAQWRDLGFPPAEQRASGEAWARWEAAAHAALGGPDRPLSSFIAADDPWRPMIDAISGYANGADLDAVSLHDWAAYEDAATEDNWALPGGYGTLVAGHAAGIDVRLGTPVTRIDHGGRTLRLDTPAGTIAADGAIICVPTTVLAAGALSFHPALPAKADAAAALPLGIADKVFLHVDRPPWAAHAHLIGDPHNACTASYRLSPFGWPIVEAFFGGACAEAMEQEDAATAFAIDELVALLGSDWRRRFVPLAATRWRGAAWIGGSYSHARVGHASARGLLAAPVDERLFFAGEACHLRDFSTAHGAYETGVAAARATLASAARPR